MALEERPRILALGTVRAIRTRQELARGYDGTTWPRLEISALRFHHRGAARAADPACGGLLDDLFIEASLVWIKICPQLERTRRLG